MGTRWIKAATQNKGGLHRSLGIPEGEKIPKARIEAATHSDNPKTAAQARLAETLEGMHHKKRSAKEIRGKLYGSKE